MSGPVCGAIARAVTRTVRLQEIADNEGMHCDFPQRWNILAFNNPKAINGHEIARAKDEQVKRGVA